MQMKTIWNECLFPLFPHHQLNEIHIYNLESEKRKNYIIFPMELSTTLCYVYPFAFAML